MKKTDARVRYTEHILKESFIKLLAKKPINKITVKEVCEMAEINRSTFYAHYSDCFALMEAIEDEILSDFEKALSGIEASNLNAVIAGIYEMVDNNEKACRTLILNGSSTTILDKMIENAKDRSIVAWKKRMPKATDAELEMLYTHLSNGLMHVVVQGYDKYSREEVAEFVNKMVRGSLMELREGICG